MRASGAWGIGEIGTRKKIDELTLSSDNLDTLLSESFFEKMDRALNSLYILLNDNDKMVLKNSIRSLGKMGNRQSVTKLIKKFQSSEDDEIKMMILSSLDEIGSYNVVKKLTNS
jgi:DNA primase large subunit